MILFIIYLYCLFSVVFLLLTLKAAREVILEYKGKRALVAVAYLAYFMMVVFSPLVSLGILYIIYKKL